MKRTIAMDRQMNALRRDRPLCVIAIRFTICEPKVEPECEPEREPEVGLEGESGKRLPSRGVTAAITPHHHHLVNAKITPTTKKHEIPR